MAGVGGKDGWALMCVPSGEYRIYSTDRPTRYFSFILEGLLTILCAIPAFWIIANFPEDAAFLTDQERAKWLYRLATNQGVTNASLPFSWDQVTKAFKDWKVYVFALM
jgi:hypothetical protein